ncbi:WD40-repeat-containing domain [Pseudocohnilembus persalinus]|uniref:Beta'-coat protein n=1 Tax=Pseudocohnilembus persalinus TaxID=266149 RepID=A0A0V0QAQ0_PSEPJ|nr:WD40-repeat-containing domain [Pseudocohnilembus persalinus]|eukprot:KRW99243.1 WD40-repeat-containing domain [Pseudocohnilembus persalinus]
MIAGIFWYLGVQILPISEAITLVMTNSMMTCILCYFFLGEKMTKIDIISIILGFTGILFIVKPEFLRELIGYELKKSDDFESQQNYFLGVLFCILGALGRSMSQILYKKIGKQADTITLSSFYSVFCMIGGNYQYYFQQAYHSLQHMQQVKKVINQRKLTKLPLKFEIKKKFISRSERIKCVDLHPELPWVLVSQYSGNLTIYDYNTQATVKTIENSQAPIRSAKFIARKQWIVAVSDDNQVRVYNYNTLEKIKTFEAHIDYIRCVVVHPEQPFIFTSSDDAKVNIWNFEQNFALHRSLDDHIHYVMDIAINPRDLNQFCTASLDRTIKVWTLSTTGSKNNFTLTGHTQGVNCVDYYKGDRPYIISGGDDLLVKIWDYQTKQCIHTLEGHQQNISSTVFHPELPIIITGSEDGTVKFWHSSTYKLETTLNYNMDRAWSINICQDNPNIVAIGYDEGTVVIKIGSDEPIASMNNGKLLWAKNLEIRSANLKAINTNDKEAVKDGENLHINMKELGSFDFQPLGLVHAPNGHTCAVYNDQEYVIFRPQTFKNHAFGQGTDFVYAPNGDYAVRESNSIKIFKSNNTLHCELRTDCQIEGLFGGQLLGVRSTDFIIFYDWESAKVVRRIDVAVKKLKWNDSGEYLAIATAEDLFILKFKKSTLEELLQLEQENEDGFEEVFEFLFELHEQVVSCLWLDNVFYYTLNSGKINYTILGKVFNFAHGDKKKFLIGYIPNQNRLYFTDKQGNVSSFELNSSLPNYLSLIQDNKIEKSRSILKNIPENQYDKIAKLLDSLDLKQEAFAIVQDQEHKFELALQLQDINSAFEIAEKTKNSNQYKQVGDVALFQGKIGLATNCFKQSNDLGSLLLIYSSLGQKQEIQQLAKLAEQSTRMNIAFVCYWITQDLNNCLDILKKSQRFSEAAIFAKTYLPSKINECVELWIKDLEENNHNITSKKIANPMEYIETDTYSDLKISLQLEQFYNQNLGNLNIDAKQFQEFKDLLSQDLFSELKNNPNFNLNDVKLFPNQTQQISQQQQSSQENDYQQQNEQEDQELNNQSDNHIQQDENENNENGKQQQLNQDDNENNDYNEE